MSNYYLHGSANYICDRCGFKYKMNQVRKEWTGLMVCHGPETNGCWEVRHPQDFVRGVVDEQSVKNPRPEADDTFLAVGDVTKDDL